MTTKVNGILNRSNAYHLALEEGGAWRLLKTSLSLGLHIIWNLHDSKEMVRVGRQLQRAGKVFGAHDVYETAMKAEWRPTQTYADACKGYCETIPAMARIYAEERVGKGRSYEGAGRYFIACARMCSDRMLLDKRPAFLRDAPAQALASTLDVIENATGQYILPFVCGISPNMNPDLVPTLVRTWDRYASKYIEDQAKPLDDRARVLTSCVSAFAKGSEGGKKIPLAVEERIATSWNKYMEEAMDKDPMEGVNMLFSSVRKIKPETKLGQDVRRRLRLLMTNPPKGAVISIVENNPSKAARKSPKGGLRR